MTGYFKVEMVIRKRGNPQDKIDSFRPTFADFIVSETDEKIVLNLPTDSVWFRDGTINDLLRTLGECIYMALAYFTNDDELVIDFDGNKIGSYEVVVENKFYKKYVKKKMMIVNEDEIKLEVVGYMFNHKFSNPLVKILDIYSVKNESKIDYSVVEEAITTRF